MRILGYVAVRRPTKAATQVRRLYYMGAQLVLTDQPRGRLSSRPAFKALRSLLLRRGDKLYLADITALGTKRAYSERNAAALEADGIDIMLLRKDYFE